MKTAKLVVICLVILVSSVKAQNLVIGGFGTIPPVGAAVFGGLSGSTIGVTASYFGHDIASVDLTINSLQLMISLGGRIALKNRDKGFDFVSVLYTPELHSSGNWLLLGLVGINFNVGPYVPKEIKKQPVFGLCLVKVL